MKDARLLVEGDGEWHAMTVAKSAHFCGLFSNIDPYDVDLRCEPRCEADDIRHLGVARWTPRREEIEPYGATDEIAQRENVALPIEEIEAEIVAGFADSFCEVAAPWPRSSTVCHRGRDPAQERRCTRNKRTSEKTVSRDRAGDVHAALLNEFMG